MIHFAELVKKIRRVHGIQIHAWRKEMSGCAWQVRYRNGKTIRWIEAPRPRCTLSLAVFLHEVGHHVIGFERYRHRCEEEYHVWRWALDELRRLGIEPDPEVRERYRLSMEYAVGRALQRGIKRLPEALKEFEPRAV